MYIHTSVAGLQVLVRATPATPTTARKPYRGEQRFVRGVGPVSATALPASGGTVTFTPVRYPVADGQRYGVEVRIVRTADGMMNSPTYADFIKSV